jgi:hypothetical protein
MAEEVETEEVEIEVDALEEEGSSETKVAPQEQEEPSSNNEDDLDSYSKGVQERIRKLTSKYRKEERDRQEAVRMAEKLLEENKKLKGRVSELDKTSVEQFGQRIQSLKSQWSAEYKRAYEAGDSDALLKAQEALNKLSSDEQRYTTAKARVSRPAPQEAQTQAQPAPQQQTQQTQPKPDPKAQQWAEKNKWFGEDPILTSAAFGVHALLVEQEGFDPNSDEYYNELDRRLKAEFPHKFKKTKSGAGAAVAPASSSASRSASKGRRTVRLSPSQIAIAKKLGVPLEEYAKYVKE